MIWVIDVGYTRISYFRNWALWETRIWVCLRVLMEKALLIISAFVFGSAFLRSASNFLSNIQVLPKCIWKCFLKCLKKKKKKRKGYKNAFIDWKNFLLFLPNAVKSAFSPSKNTAKNALPWVSMVLALDRKKS